MINYLKDFLAKNAGKNYEITFCFASGKYKIEAFGDTINFNDENTLLCTKDGEVSILNVNLIERIEFN